jgi:hypothetical protein
VRRLEETLLAASKGSRAAVVVFRPGWASSDRYQVANHDERIEWTVRADRRGHPTPRGRDAGRVPGDRTGRVTRAGAGQRSGPPRPGAAS